TESGVEATTIEMIRDRSGASIGSLYHHFGNRERIIAALYLEGIGEYAALLEAGLIETLDAEACVRLFVTSYITESGVEATTIEMIRDRSGASIGSLYHHFGNRE
ncbi:TetR/AcrR family transcriptional regulator, partial [Acinetobacter baumannii]|uniref:TetR/AcrR family transcriptional regulator n=1 Tax=Acinetobacter baumannii TaxID=470 RepID=UPI001D17A349